MIDNKDVRSNPARLQHQPKLFPYPPQHRLFKIEPAHGIRDELSGRRVGQIARQVQPKIEGPASSVLSTTVRDIMGGPNCSARSAIEK